MVQQKRASPSPAGVRKNGAHRAIPISAREFLGLPVVSPRIKMQRLVESAVAHCGSAAALARELGVKPPTVSQWRSRRKLPDALKLLRIQELAIRLR